MIPGVMKRALDLSKSKGMSHANNYRLTTMIKVLLRKAYKDFGALSRLELDYTSSN